MSERQFILTLDVDWAPDFMIRETAEILLKHRVSATWFVTHASPAIDELRQHRELFELAIHPNFLPGSTHGSDPRSVLEHCLELVPEAFSMRTHGLVQSSHLFFQVMQETPVRVDVSTFLPVRGSSEPAFFWRRGTQPLMKLPFVWEDDFEFENPQRTWDGQAWIAGREGLNVLGFHPVHLALNSPDEDPYFALKRRRPHLTSVLPEDVKGLRHEGAGAQSFFRDVVAYLAANPAEFTTVKDFAMRHFSKLPA